MNIQTLTLGDCRFEALTEDDRFVGLGAVWIGDTKVRSGRLPIAVHTHSFTGLELNRLELQGIDKGAKEIRIRSRAVFRAMRVKVMKDHSLDPIHETGDWDTPRDAGVGNLDIVLRSASDSFNSVKFGGFSYHYEYSSKDVPLYWLLDQASWELDGDIAGTTIYSQSACSDPVVEIKPDTFFTTEGELFFLDNAAHYNRVMTHNLPRWADHQAFDFQFKNDGRTLVGVYEKVDLIRTLLRREPGKAELKTFDKHIFDEALTYKTVPKKILINRDPKTNVAQQNAWTWMFEDTNQRARDEFGLKYQQPVPTMGQHHWVNYTIDTYYKDIVPACAAIGIKQIFAENFKKSDGSELDRLPMGNMCGSKEYEISERLGGTKKFKEYIDRCHALGIKNFMWTNTYVSTSAKINPEHRTEGEKSWYMAMEDTRTKYAGAYTSVSSNIDLKNPVARKYWVDAHKKIVEETGLDGFFVDSYYNLFFMPVDYKTGHPRTVWRESLEVFKELQDIGVEWQIEAFGPFGQPGHGHPASYDVSKVFISYDVGLGNDYVTVPVPGAFTDRNIKHDPGFIFYVLAHKVPIAIPLFSEEKRIDTIYGDVHRRILREYHELLPVMHRRYLQEDNLSVLWHDEMGAQAILWNFTDRTVKLPGKVRDLTLDQDLPAGATQLLKGLHVYSITGGDLPTRIA